MMAHDVAPYIKTRIIEDPQRQGDEEVFPLLGHDFSSPSVVAFWILQNIDTAPAEKLREALACALKMRQTPGRKVAD